MKKFTVIGLTVASVLFSVNSVSAIDWENLQQGISATVKQYAPYATIVQSIWDKQSLAQIIQGKYDIPDDAINAALAKAISDNDKVKTIQITSHEDGRMDIYADTLQYGGVYISGKIDAFVHDGTKSYMVYTVKDKDLENHGGITGWLFSHLSVALLEKLVGHISLGDDITTTVQGNTVTVDYSQALQKSELAQVTIGDYSLIDALHIDGAVPHDGYVEFNTSLRLPEEIQNLLVSMVNNES